MSRRVITAGMKTAENPEPDSLVGGSKGVGGRTGLIELAVERSAKWMQAQIAAIDPAHPDDVTNGYLDIWRRILEATITQIAEQLT